ncbi:hypothetical protein FS749_000477 [Ceratobasidium sp. UAMH 11750]|nr:hypothetical protein FS749_000477 [Ceratobasidium sp. UAMH 11750]
MVGCPEFVIACALNLPRQGANKEVGETGVGSASACSRDTPCPAQKNASTSRRSLGTKRTATELNLDASSSQHPAEAKHRRRPPPDRSGEPEPPVREGSDPGAHEAVATREQKVPPARSKGKASPAVKVLPSQDRTIKDLRPDSDDQEPVSSQTAAPDVISDDKGLEPDPDAVIAGWDEDVEALRKQVARALEEDVAVAYHESPVILTVNADLIDPALRQRMRDANTCDLLSDIPRLELLSKHGELEQTLENELWLGRTETRWLDDEEVEGKREQLKTLRKQRLLCMLLNGNHRLRAMLKIGQEVEREWRELADRIWWKVGGQDEWEADVKWIIGRVHNLTWRCKVYDLATLSEAGKNALVQNRHQRPAQGMGSGEKGWFLACKFGMEVECKIQAAAQDPERTEPMRREEVLNIVQAKWRMEIGSKMLMTGMEDEADAVKMSDMSDSLKDITGNEPSSRLFFNPLSMEMVIDIQLALCVFDHCLERSWAIEMLWPSGGPLVAHYWLDARVLIKIFSAAADEATLKTALEFIDKQRAIGARGIIDAVDHFDRLHERYERFPPLLEHYDLKHANKFAEFYLKALDTFKRDGRPFVDEDRPDALMKLRAAFYQWGQWLLDQGKKSADNWETTIGALACLYALLPTYRKGAIGRTLFYLMAALPAPGIFKTYLERWSAGWAVPRNGDSLILVSHNLYGAGTVLTQEQARGAPGLGANHLDAWCPGDRTVG